MDGHTCKVDKRAVGANTLKGLKRRKKDNEPLLVERPGHSSFHANLNKPLVDIRTAPKGTYDLRDLEEDWTVLDGDWEAFDPGLTNLYTGDRGTSMTRREWRHRTGADKAVARANRRNRKIQDVLVTLSRASLKSASVDVLTNHMLEWLGHWTKLWSHYTDDWWGRQRFSSYVKQQKALAKIADDILGKDRSKVRLKRCVINLS